jgi:hypothetical protein
MAYWLGQLFLWAGFIGGAFNAVRFQEVADDKWSTVSWWWYGVSVVVGVVGVILLRGSSRAVTESSHRVEAEYSVLTDRLAILLAKVGELRAEIGSLPPSKIVAFIDAELAEPFSDFADARNALVQRFGLQAFADVMTQFASGERFVNRAWSAAADGYRDESSVSLERAQQHLQRASELMSGLTLQA